MLILDTSEIQARKPDPQVREISRITWAPASIPQNAIPFTEDGHPYVLEFDEYNASTLGSGSPDDVGAARIIDIADETQPARRSPTCACRSTSPPTTRPRRAIRARPARRRATRRTTATSRRASTRRSSPARSSSPGLRLFDISDLVHPKEIGYFVAPTQAKRGERGQASDFAMSQPAFVPERHEIWFTDGDERLLRAARRRRRLAGKRAFACAGLRRGAASHRTRHAAPPLPRPLGAGGPRGQARARVAPRPHADRARRPARLDPAHGAPAQPGAAEPRRTLRASRVCHPCA